MHVCSDVLPFAILMNKTEGLDRHSPAQGLIFVNEYALVSTLGRGSFGEVKLALNTKDFEVYALKLLPKELRRRRSFGSNCPNIAEARVMSEINVMKQLSHPNIVRLIEVIGAGLLPSKLNL